jgi:hypothetical protein
MTAKIVAVVITMIKAAYTVAVNLILASWRWLWRWSAVRGGQPTGGLTA